jgi:hypothetical protein
VEGYRPNMLHHRDMLLEAKEVENRSISAFHTRISVSSIAIALSVLALLVIVARWYRNDYLIASVDLFPDYAPLNLLQKSFFTWNEGTPFGGFAFPTFTTYYLLTWILSAVTSTALAEITTFWLFMATAWLGAFVLCRALGFGLPASLAAAWAYVLSPVAQFLPSFITADAYASALPWLLWMMLEGASNPPSRKRLAALAITTSFLIISWIASTPQLFFELLFILVGWALFILRYAKPGFVAWAAQTSILSVAAAAWWIVPVLFTVFSSIVVHATKSADVAWSFENASLLDNLRFITAWTWKFPYYIPYANGYDANVATYAAGFWGTTMLAVSLLFRRSRYAALARFAALVAVIGFFIAKGMHSPLEGVNAFIYSLPGLVMFIEPAGFIIAALLMVSLAIAIVTEELQLFAVQSGFRARIAFGACILGTVAACLLSASPLLSGLIFSGLERGGVSNYIAVPPYWFEAAAAIDDAPGRGAVLVLPADDTYQMIYNWKYQGVDVIPLELIKRPVLLQGSSLNYFSDVRVEDIKKSLAGSLAFQSRSSAAALRTLGIRFILCRKDVVFRQDVEGDDCHSSFLAGNAVRRTYGELVVYDLGHVAPRYGLADSREGSVKSRQLAGFLHVVTLPRGAKDVTLTDLQLYHPAWTAIEIWPRPSVLAHRALGWRNAWTVPAGGKVLIFNAVNALEGFLAILGALLTVTAIVRAKAA